nr:immunoglobulin heavy chain junction region [Macaca mulatta]MOV39471.1 immunoglobulin heavy chain junction region [Macaca mulatta]MOV40432.1 immunoglobulin heavy chain junction region [Macaca mulatta]MOV40840.1 immunoglobulin heavy chain junction region [Macaca mulatta]MOV42763.1 immunoglobulin heavy chain junction region [Macaca mulatta]
CALGGSTITTDYW